MFSGHRVVVCIPAGRQRYMLVLLPYLLAERHSLVDEVHLWVNTDVPEDLAYFERMESQHRKVRRVNADLDGPLRKATYDASRDHHQYSDSICRFYRRCVEPGTVYVKMDDDICFEIGRAHV